MLSKYYNYTTEVKALIIVNVIGNGYQEPSDESQFTPRFAPGSGFKARLKCTYLRAWLESSRNCRSPRRNHPRLHQARHDLHHVASPRMAFDKFVSFRVRLLPGGGGRILYLEVEIVFCVFSLLIFIIKKFLELITKNTWVMVKFLSLY